MKFVRIKPFNGRTHVKRTHTVFGIKFQVEKGWYKVDDDVAEYLRDVPMNDHGPDAEFSPKAFDIVDTMAEAKAIDEKEKSKAVRNAPERAERKTRVHQPTLRAPVKRSSLAQPAEEEVEVTEPDADLDTGDVEEEDAETGDVEEEVEETSDETEGSAPKARVGKKKKKRSSE